MLKNYEVFVVDLDSTNGPEFFHGCDNLNEAKTAKRVMDNEIKKMQSLNNYNFVSYIIYHAPE